MEGDCAHVCKCYLFQKGPSFAVEHYDKVQSYALKLKTCESRSGLYKYILFPLTLRGYNIISLTIWHPSVYTWTKNAWAYLITKLMHERIDENQITEATVYITPSDNDDASIWPPSVHGQRTGL